MNETEFCRTCFSSTNLVPIFNGTFHNLDDEEIMCDLLNVTGFMIEKDDILSQLICTKCKNFITKCVNFRKKCEETNSKLTELLVKTETEADTETIVIEDDVSSDVSEKKVSDTDDNIEKVGTFEEFTKEKDVVFTDETKYNKADLSFVKMDEDMEDEKMWPCKHSPKMFQLTEETNNKFTELVERKETETLTIVIEDGVSNDDSEVEVPDTDDYIKKTGSFEEFMKEKDVVFTNKKKYNKVDLSFLKLDEDMVVHDDDDDDKKESWPCKLCPKVCQTKKKLWTHQRIHTAVKEICQYCGKALKDEHALLVHYKAMHGYEKTDKCRFCDYRGTRPELVRIHERKHTGEKPYVCEQCGAGFHRRSSYVTHVPLHLPEKTVKCDLCPAMFKSITLMHIHKSNAHRRPRRAAAEVDNIWIK